MISDTRRIAVKLFLCAALPLVSVAPSLRMITGTPVLVVAEIAPIPLSRLSNRYYDETFKIDTRFS
jgi:hypothetical protein